MNFNYLKNLISEIVLKEIGDTNVRQFGSDALMGQITQQLVGIVNKYGGDHDKAFASPEWAQATSQAEQSIGKEKTNSLLGAQPIQEPPEDILKGQSSSKPASTTGTTGTAPTGSAGGVNNADSRKARIQALSPKSPVSGKTDPSMTTANSLAAQSQAQKQKTQQRLQALRVQKKAPIQEGIMTGITKTITEMVRKILAEEIDIYSEELGPDLSRSNNPDEPEHGQQTSGPDGTENYTYHAGHQAWLAPHEWDELEQAALDDESLMNSQYGDPELTSGEDPEASMIPSDRAAMIDSLLMMEFEETPKKTIPTAVVESLVRKAVRKSLRGEE